MVLSSMNDVEDASTDNFPITMHISEGRKYYQKLQFENANHCFDLALKIQPTNMRSLLGKAKCFFYLAQYEKSKEYVEKLLKVKPDDLEANVLKGEMQYLSSNFEQSFLDFCFAHSLKPFHSRPRIGQQVCLKAIYNSLKPDTKLVLDHQDVHEVNKFLKQGIKTQCVKRVPKHLDEDMKFVQTLLNDQDMEAVSEACREIEGFINNNKEFWRMQNPYTKRSKFVHGGFKLDSQRMMKKASQKRDLSASFLLERDFESCKKTCLETLETLKRIPQRTSLPVLRIKADTLHLVGQAYMLEDDIPSALKYHKLQLEISKKNFPEIRHRALRVVGEDYFENKSFKTAMGFLEQSLNFDPCGTDVAVVYYKIADCALHMNRLKYSKECAEKAVELARLSKFEQLLCYALMVVAEVEVRQKNRGEAEVLYKEALNIAREIKDPRLKDIEDLINRFYGKQKATSEE